MDEKLATCLAYMRRLRAMMERPAGAEHPSIAATLAKGIKDQAMRAEMEKMAADKERRDRELAEALDAGIKVLESEMQGGNRDEH